jgi:acetolactate synthase I/II/III large subunit
LGLVRQQQELFYDQHYIASKFEVKANYPAIARGFGIGGFGISETFNLVVALTQALESKSPCLVDIPVDPYAMVTPMVPPGKANTETAV